jgi:hypothetical protein
MNQRQTPRQSDADRAFLIVLARDSSLFALLRFFVAACLDRVANFVRPGVSIADIRPGMSPAMERKTISAIFFAMGGRSSIRGIMAEVRRRVEGREL